MIDTRKIRHIRGDMSDFFMPIFCTLAGLLTFPMKLQYD